jgi:hypothetical protein
MNTQPIALLLAEKLEQQFPLGTAQHYLDGEAAAELRRLHAVNEELLVALHVLLNNNECLTGEPCARAAIAKATGEQA